MASITSANTIFTLAISGLYTIPQQLQGFSADDIFDTEQIAPSEIIIGVDGVLSAGFTPQLIKQSIMLQADSPSNTLFEAWWTAMAQAQDVLFATGIVHFPSINRSYTLVKGALSGHAPMPDAKKVLQPRKYGITWQAIVGTPL